MEFHLKSYGITQCYLALDTIEHTPSIETSTLFTYLGGMEGRVDQLTYGRLVAYRDGLPAQCQLTTVKARSQRAHYVSTTRQA